MSVDPLQEAHAAPAATSQRIRHIAAEDPQLQALITRMVGLASQGLPAMFRRDCGQFAYTRTRQPDGRITAEGTSLRYGAITALGARHLDEAAQRAIFGGDTAAAFVGGAIRSLPADVNLGDLALLTWAAAAMSLEELPIAIERLRRCNAATCDAYTVEAAWVVSALTAAHGQADVQDLLRDARDRLLTASSMRSGIFPHWTNPAAAPWYRRHVACFADQVYPIQALARYHHAMDHRPSLMAATRCADQICRLQGHHGQWWWHYDHRTGAVVEGYPVYSVHQDSMAPMALLDLTEAGGTGYERAIRLGLTWMQRAAEVNRCLIQDDTGVIWRKVTRTGPTRFARTVRAGASRIHPRIRVKGLNFFLPPTAIDYECRPYHLGWILDTWLGGL